MAGIGCGIQGIGLAMLVLAAITFRTVWGPMVFGLLGLSLLAIGGSKASWWECSECGTRLAGRHVRQCPACGAGFSKQAAQEEPSGQR